MFKLVSKARKNEKGFTLVELMVVVVIIGILVAIAIPIYNTVTANAEERACFATQRTIEGAVQIYIAQDVGNAAADVNGDPTVDGLVANVTCPSGGTITLTDGRTDCTGADGHGPYR